jgi:outer membrane lipopolysaccharide assembly protein LptE/RlpB
MILERTKKTVVLLFCTAIALAVAGCGYQFAGGGEFPYGVKKIAVEVLSNRTSEVGLENTITNDLIYELNRSGQVQVVDPKNADAVIQGSIEKLAIRSVSRSSILTSEAERVFVFINLQMVRPDGEVLWKENGIKEDEAYSVGSDKLGTEANRRQAINNLSPRLAQKIYNRMTANF